MVAGTTNGSGDTASAVAAVEWLLTQLSGSSEHSISSYVAWYARQMILGMSLLMQLIVLVARFFKVTPWQDRPRQLHNPFWFVTARWSLPRRVSNDLGDLIQT
jgi:hypothetical protein